MKRILSILLLLALYASPSISAGVPFTGTMDAGDVDFSPGSSGLTSTNVDSALKELSTLIGTISTSGSGPATWGSITGSLSSQGDLYTTLGLKQDANVNLDIAADITGTNKYYGTNGAGVVGSYDLPSGGLGGTWGTIVGTLANQTDLANALNGKINTSSIGSSVQAYDPDLSTFAGITPSSDAQTLLTHSFAQMLSDIGAAASSHTQAESTLTFTNITTGNATTSNHGFLKMLDNNANHYMDGQGNWTAPTVAYPGSGIAVSSGSGWSTSLTDSHTNWDAGYTYRLTGASGTSPLTLTLSANSLTGSVANASADGSTRGISTYTAADFDSSSGVISLDYSNGQKASGSQAGFLSSTDWTTFNNKMATNGNGSSITNLNGSAIASGTVPIAYLPTGTGASQVALGDHTHSGTYQTADATLSALAALNIQSGSVLTGTGTDAFSMVRSTSGITYLKNDNGTIAWDASAGGSMIYPSGTGFTVVSGGAGWGTTVTDPLPANHGGTGVANNSANTITFTGNYSLGLTLTNNTALTAPTSGTLSTLAGSESLTNKKLGSLTSNGFVKTSGSDGTLSVDTSTYLTSANIDSISELNAIVGVTLLQSGGALGTPSSGTLTNCTFPNGLNSINGLTETAGGILTMTADNTYSVLAIGSAGKLNRSTGSAPAWSTLTMPDTIAAGSVFAANSANVMSAVTSASGTYVLTNTNGTITWGSAGTGTIVGSTGSTDNAILTANGTGGSTVQQNSGATISDTGILNLPTGGSIQINGTTMLSAGSAGTYGVEIGYNGTYTGNITDGITAINHKVYVRENETSKVVANLTDPQTFAGALTLTSGIASIGAASNLSGGTVTLGTIAGSINAGSATSFTIPNGASVTTGTFGMIGADNNAWATGRGAVQFYDGTANTLLLGVLSSDTPSNGQVPKWNTGGTITWEDEAAGGASASGDTIGQIQYWTTGNALAHTAGFQFDPATSRLLVPASTHPTIGVSDSDMPGTSKDVALLGGEYVSGSEGAENTSVFLKALKAGSWVTYLTADGVNDEVSTAYDVEITSASKGLIIRSANGTRFRITITDAGVLTATSL